jgi:uncharacterized protein (TIGR02271 family)
MSDETIVAVYDTAAHAEAAVRDMLAANVPQSAISQHADTTDVSTGTTAQSGREQGFWSSLFGGEPDHDSSVYDRSLQGGSTVVTVKVPEAHVASVMQILESHNPVDIDERAASYASSQTTTTRAPLGSAMPVETGMMAKTQSAAATTTAGMTGRATADAESLQLSEERLAVGKRLVNRGGTRIRRFVVETPVEQQVTLHDEKVVVERRPVTDARPVGTADFSEKTVEMTESAEEAVVSKQAYVKEEVNLRKQATERVETIRDTVRSEDIEVEQVPSAKMTSTTTTPVTPSVPGASKI